MSETYQRQVALLVRVLPHVAAEECFALKGGTAINLFVRNMPRLSVDIDLTYLPVAPRAQSLAAIDAAMNRVAARIAETVNDSRVVADETEGATTRLTVRANGVQIKIEVTPVLRGCVFEPAIQGVSASVEEQFGYAEMRVASFEDLYGGKLVAALDRQHPRDLFDVRDLLANEGISDDLRRAFVVYLISHGRPMSELLAPTRKDLTVEFARGFEGMTVEPVSRDELERVREEMIEELVTRMPADHRRFLISFEIGTPDWTLLGLPDAARLPAVLWRQQNLDTLEPARRAALVRRLEAALSLDTP